MNVIYRMNLDVAHPTRMHTLTVKQNDHKSREIEFRLFSNGEPLDMTDVLFATIKGIKPDGESVIYADAEIQENVIRYVIADSFVEVPGRYAMELELLSSESEVLSSFDFHIDVQNQLYDEDDYVTESDLNGFRSYMLQTKNAAMRAETIAREFSAGYGDIGVLVEQLRELKESLDDTIEDLEQKVADGFFNGAQGERGSDAVVTEMPGLVSLQIVGTNLIATY